MKRRAVSVPVVLVAVAAAALPAMASVLPVNTVPAPVPLLSFTPLPTDGGLMRGTLPSGLLSLPPMSAYMPHMIASGPPKAAPASALAAIDAVAPLPPPRPRALETALAPAETPPELRRSTDMTATACGNVAALGYALAVPKPPIDGPGECDVPEVVDLTGVVLVDGRRVTIEPPATLNCAMAEQVARWVREDLAPAATRIGHGFRTIRNFASYDCRGRNRNPMARMSEHGRANALDIRGFEGEDGRWMVINGADMPPALLAQMKRGACQRFMTVLGPGSDGFHESHVHVDLAERRSGMRLCHFDLPGETSVAGGGPATQRGPAGGPFITAATPRPAAAPTQARSVPLPPPRPSGL